MDGFIDTTGDELCSLELKVRALENEMSVLKKRFMQLRKKMEEMLDAVKRDKMD